MVHDTLGQETVGEFLKRVEQFADRVNRTLNYRTNKPGVLDTTVQLNLAAVSSYHKWRVGTGRSKRNAVK